MDSGILYAGLACPQLFIKEILFLQVPGIYLAVAFPGGIFLKYVLYGVPVRGMFHGIVKYQLIQYAAAQALFAKHAHIPLFSVYDIGIVGGGGADIYHQRRPPEGFRGKLKLVAMAGIKKGRP